MKELAWVDSFDDIIGQNAAKEQFNEFLRNQRKFGVVPPILLIAARGEGKTKLAKSFATRVYLRDTKYPKPFLRINASQIQNVPHLWEEWLLPHAFRDDGEGKQVTIFLDEVHALGSKVADFFKSLLEPNAEDKNTARYGGREYVFDLRDITWLAATTDPQKLDNAVEDRFQRISLEAYTPEELGRILMIRLPGRKIKETLLAEIASVLRGNARAADKMGGHISRYMKIRGIKELTEADWRVIKRIYGIRKFGLSTHEIMVLRHLRESGPSSLTNLYAKTRMNRQALQQDIEIYLQTLNLMKIGNGGRQITTKGISYLRELGDEKPVDKSR